MAEQAERVREQIGDGRPVLVAAGQAQRGGVAGDRLVERQPAARAASRATMSAATPLESEAQRNTVSGVTGSLPPATVSP